MSYDAAPWLAGQPVLQAIMHIVGLFDRPASGDSVAGTAPGATNPGLTEATVDLDEGKWRHALARVTAE